MYLPLCSLAFGLLTLRFLPQLPSFNFLFFILLSAIFLLSLAFYPHKFLRPSRHYLISAFLLILGFCFACVQAQKVLDDRLDFALDGSVLWLTGTIDGLPDVKEQSTTFILKNAKHIKYQVPQKIRVSWYQAPNINSGDVWRLAVKLKRPKGLLNPASFDLEAFLTAHKIGAVGTVRMGEKISTSQVLVMREKIRHKLQQISPYGQALAALVVGDKSALSASDWQLLQATGTVHLMVISGTHIGMLALFLFAFCKLIVRCAFKLGFNCRSWLLWTWLIVAFGAIFYGYLAGFGVPVIRACIMLIAVFIWRIFLSELKPFLVWLLALNCVLVLDPLASLQTGFWLSFAAVLALLMIFANRPISANQQASKLVAKLKIPQIKGFIFALTKAQFAATVALLPLLLWFALPISLISPLANFIAVPFIGFITIPLSLIGTLFLLIAPIGELILQLAGLSLSLLFSFLQYLAAYVPPIHAQTVPVPNLMLAIIGAFIALSPLPVRFLGLLLLLTVFLSFKAQLNKAEAEIWLFDVGQGLSMLIRTQNHALLYDAAANYNGFNRGEKVVAPALWGLGVKKLDLMLISHGDNDHAGGAPFIAQNFAPKQILSGEPKRLPFALKAELCTHNATWIWDEVKFKIIFLDASKQGNDASCMLQIEANGERLLLTGDIEQSTEFNLLKANIDVQTNWLLAPHHGSKSSSSLPFLQASKAHSVLISRGNHNAFGHPHSLVLKRYQALDLAIFDTAKTGAQQIMLGKKQPLFALRRLDKFWREP